MFCHACGDRQEENAKFCGSCGMPLLTATPPAVASPVPTSNPARGTRAVVASKPTITADDVSINAVMIKGTGPDRDGDVNVECALDIEYSGVLPVPLVRLRWVVLDGADALPLHETEAIDCQSDDLEAGDERTVSESALVRFPKGTEDPQLEVRPTLLLYPVEWHALGALELPGEDRAEQDGVTEAGPLAVTRWWAQVSDADESSVVVNFGLCVRNAGADFLSMAVARCLVQGRKGQEFANESVYVQGLAPGEERLLTATAWVSEDVRTRRGAKLVVKVGSTGLPVVVQVPAETCEVAPPEEEPDEDDELDDEDGDAESGDDDEQSDEDGDHGTVAEGSAAADRGPVECVVICDEESLILKVAAFYCQSADDSTKWVYYVGDDKAGGFESGFMCLMVNEAQSDYEHFYLSVDGESFSRDVVTGKDVQVALRPEDRTAFEALLTFCNSWVMFDEDSETYTVQRKRRRLLTENDADSTQLEHYSSGIDLDLLNLMSANWAVQFQFSFE